jgi:hypothetical protein
VPDEEDDEPELDPDVEVEVESEFVLALFLGVEALSPQPTNVAAARMTRQVFTRDSPALIWK